MKRIISILAVLCLLLTMMPLSAWAKTVDKVQQVDLSPQVNPLYADVLDREAMEEALAKLPEPVEPYGNEYVSEEEGVQQIRDQMKLRTPSFTIRVRTTNWDLGAVVGDMFYAAFDHTGVPNEGDYLMWQWGMWQLDDWDYYTDGDVIYLEVVYGVMYYNDAAQEAQLNTAVAELLEELDLEGRTDYEKICGIYAYMTENITYDYYHLETNPDYYPMYTAYAALVNKTAVCQGYANLFYRLALELGVDARIIVGDAGGPHAWNIVELDEVYYYADSTWDASYAQAGWDYWYFLRGTLNFMDHQADVNQCPFITEYPISFTDYDPENPGQPGQPIIPEYPETDYLECEWEVLKLTNRERQAVGLSPLTTHKTLFEAADMRTVELTVLYDHIRPNGIAFAYLLDELDFPWYWAGECIAAGPQTPEEAIAYWMNDADYRDILLDPDFKHVGVGYRTWDDANGYYWDQFFTSVEDYCVYTGMELSADYLEVELGTQLEDLQLWATYYCDCCGECYLPVLPEYCEGYDPDCAGTQTVTVSCLGYTATLTINVMGGIENGDANGDAVVDAKDLILMRQYLAGWTVTVDATGGDANGDGEVDARDLILLRQYLAGWSVTLGPQE